MNGRLHCTHTQSNSRLEVLFTPNQKHRTTHPVNYCTTQSHEPTGRGGKNQPNTNSTSHSREICLPLTITSQRGGEGEREREQASFGKGDSNTRKGGSIVSYKPISNRKDKRHTRISAAQLFISELIMVLNGSHNV